ncbi:MAG TPA: 16S rRNA (uracil(1498)-N(3))-methyltransferase [Methylococcaceae bacterium]|nr:16S rRNA (uracil(1498)-N(3))-methyltransferase [Methylococcaceae bacterium]
MRVSRLYLPLGAKPGEPCTLDTETGHYLRDVLRLNKGDALTVFDGTGGEYAAEVAAAGKREVVLQVGEFRDREAESSLRVDLGLGVTRGERMDYAVQKAVELGVARIAPLVTERCVVRLDPQRWAQRAAHWRKVAMSACEQCGRNRPPRLDEPGKLTTWLGAQSGLRLFCDPRASTSLRELARPAENVCLLAGPEGGFSAEERELARAAGFTPVRLGPRVLRAETAALAALAALQALWGDLG